MITLTGDETKKDLLAICEANGIETDQKAKNEILISLIRAHEDFVGTDGIPKEEEISDDEIPGEVLDPNGIVMVKTTSKLDDIIEDNEACIYVTVTDHDNTQTVEDDAENRLYQAVWGNMLCTPRRESVLVNSGVPQYVSRGMIKHMNTITIPVFTTGTDGKVKVGTKKRFSINEQEGWTKEQLDALKEKQKGRITS